ncbi:MAG TPA: MFS transporter [Candidatus Marinimicrobia bacterium]|nr:MFS transporter [Candidatus Neomarinimicrobiota bacterium]
MKIDQKFEFGNVLTVSFAHLVHDIYASFLAPILPLLIEKFGITIFLAGLLDVIRKIPALANPFIGLIADKICVRYFIILAPSVTAISMGLLGAAPHYTILMVLFFVAGIGSTLFHVPAPVMIKHVSYKQIGKGMSFYMLGGELARTLGPLTILGAVSLWGLEGTYRLIPFGLVASVILYFRLHRIEIKKDFGKKKGIGARKTFVGLIPFFISIGGFVFFRAGMKSALTIYLPTYLTSKGATLWMAGASLSVLQFAGAGGTFFAGIISDKIGRKNSLLVIAIMNPILMWLFVKFNGVLIVPILIVTGFFLFASGPVLLALVHDLDTKHMSFINGVYMTISFGLSSIMVLLVGLAADKIGLELTYKIAAGGALGSIPFVLSLKSDNKMKEND